jgi:hypothetical protein
MTAVERALMTKELGKAQAALWAAFTIAAKTHNLDVAKALREQYKTIGTAIVKLNGGPVITLREMLR